MQMALQSIIKLSLHVSLFHATCKFISTAFSSFQFSYQYFIFMDNSRTARQATDWELKGNKRKPGRPRKNWVDVIKRDLRQMDLTWEEAEELANEKAEWCRRVAQCSHLDAG